MSVPTTLQGTHDECGGVVVFRPAVRRRELLAGECVQLSAVCRGCGATVTTSWSLPTSHTTSDDSEVAWQSGTGSAAAFQQEDLAELPLAAGAEEWHSSLDPHASARNPGSAVSQRRSTSSGVTELSSWRDRGGSGSSGRDSRQDQHDRPPQRQPLQMRGAVPEPQSKPERSPETDAFMARFAERIESARTNLERLHKEMPSVLEAGVSESTGFRSPQLSPRPDLGSSGFSATPTGLRTSNEPTTAMLELDAPLPAALQHELDAAIVAAPDAMPDMPPAVLDELHQMADSPELAAPRSAPSVPTPTPVPAPAPAPAAAPGFMTLSATIASTTTDAYPPSQLPVTPPVPPAPAGAAGFELPPRAEAIASPLAPTHSDDAMAGVWDAPATHAPPSPPPPLATGSVVSPTAPPAPPAPQAATPPAPPLAMTIPPPLSMPPATLGTPAPAAPMPPAPMAVTAPMPPTSMVAGAMPAAPTPTTPPPAGAMPPAPTTPADAPMPSAPPVEATGDVFAAALPASAAPVADTFSEPARGFDWGNESAAPAAPKRRRRPKTALDSPATETTAPGRFSRVRMTPIEIFFVILLVSLVPLLIYKISSFSSDGAAASSGAPTAAQVAPAAPATAKDGATAGAGAKASTPAKSGAKAKQPAADKIPKITKSGSVGTAGTAAASGASKAGNAQVDGADADTALVPTRADAESNPFARPEQA